MEEIKECPKGMVPISVLVAECERIKQNDRSTCSEAFLACTIKRVVEWIDSPAYKTQLAACGFKPEVRECQNGKK